MQFELLTLSGLKFRGDVREVRLDTPAGRIGVLPKHEAMTAIVSPGPVVVKTAQGEEEVFATFGGILDVQERSVRLLADEAEHLNELIHSEIEEALAKARQIQQQADEDHDLHLIQQEIGRHELRLEIIRSYRPTK